MNTPVTAGLRTYRPNEISANGHQQLIYIIVRGRTQRYALRIRSPARVVGPISSITSPPNHGNGAGLNGYRQPLSYGGSGHQGKGIACETHLQTSIGRPGYGAWR